MRRIWATAYWPSREDEAIDDVFFSETPRLPSGLCDQFFVTEIPRVRWLIAYRATRLALRDRRWRDQSTEAAKRITSAVGHAIGWGRGGMGDPTDAQFDRLVTAAYIAIGEYHWPTKALSDAGYETLATRPALPPLGTALTRPAPAQPQFQPGPILRAA